MLSPSSLVTSLTSSSLLSPQVRLWSPMELRNLEDRLLGLGPSRWAELRQQVSQWG